MHIIKILHIAAVEKVDSEVQSTISIWGRGRWMAMHLKTLENVIIKHT
jgi:hypothetical protein